MKNNFRDYDPKQFIEVILFMFQEEKQTIESIATYFEVSPKVIKRIINMYDKKISKQKESDKKKIKGIKELKDPTRNDTEKITDDDIKDLEIDLNLFSKGKEPENNK